mmetsp:Transcript_24280/g.38158  ORF Transcript_24280/g.38158 Transcript_24280/m.38158 type:complete len:353 (+) Transcript_24280:108-1166(+)
MMSCEVANERMLEVAHTPKSEMIEHKPASLKIESNNLCSSGDMSGRAVDYSSDSLSTATTPSGSSVESVRSSPTDFKMDTEEEVRARHLQKLDDTLPSEIDATLQEHAMLLLHVCATALKHKNGKKRKSGGQRKSASGENTPASTKAEGSSEDVGNKAEASEPAFKRARSSEGGEPRKPKALLKLTHAAVCLADGVEISATSRATGVARGNYKCGRCGQPKKGHVCTVPASESEDKAEDSATDSQETSELQQDGADNGADKTKKITKANKPKNTAQLAEDAAGLTTAGTVAADVQVAVNSAVELSQVELATVIQGHVKACVVPNNSVCALFLAGCSANAATQSTAPTAVAAS